MGMIIGIDLGTTNSVACIKKITVSVIHNAEGEALTPSCVTAIPQADNISFDFVVGQPARDLLKQYPEQTITSVKRLIGRDFEDLEVQNLIKNRRVSYDVQTDASELGSIKIPLGGKLQTPEMISGMILSKLIRDGEVELQGQIDQAVVTVPAYFSDRQKFATRAACDYAGIKLLRLLPEPTAAALSFGLSELNKDAMRTVMVFDLGGGTFDISVLSLVGGSFMEITKGGDMWLGGDNIDTLLVDHIFSSAQKTAQCESIPALIEKLSPADKARFLVEIKEKAEAAKIALSTEESTSVEMFGLLKDENGQWIDIDVTIHRQEFDELLTPIIKRVAHMSEQILHEIRFEPELIDTVLMVGGSSLVPAIQEELKRLFGVEKVMIHPRPMLAVAEGAALMAAQMANRSEADAPVAFAMMHTTAHDYYLQLANGHRHLLVARNTPLPVVVEEKLSFLHSEQSLARLRVFNEVEGVLDTVGELWFHKEETNATRNNAPAELMLRFSVDEDNIIIMKAWSLQNEELQVEAQIARGGLATKLYNDLERALSTIVANCQRRGVEENALRLSCRIVSTILSASDPITGETRTAQKQKAQQQIIALKDCQEKDLSPLDLHRFAAKLYAVAAPILSDEKNTYLQERVSELKQALDSLEDAAVLERLENELHEFYDEIPIAITLTRAEDAAEFLEAEYPGDAKKIRQLKKQLIDACQRGGDSLIEELEDALHEQMHLRLSWSDTVATGRFDRDVCL